MISIYYIKSSKNSCNAFKWKLCSNKKIVQCYSLLLFTYISHKFLINGLFGSSTNKTCQILIILGFKRPLWQHDKSNHPHSSMRWQLYWRSYTKIYLLLLLLSHETKQKNYNITKIYRKLNCLPMVKWYNLDSEISKLNRLVCMDGTLSYSTL